MSSDNNININFDEPLLDLNNTKRELEEDETILNDQNKRIKIAEDDDGEDPLSSVFADLPPLDLSNTPSVSPGKLKEGELIDVKPNVPLKTLELKTMTLTNSTSSIGPTAATLTPQGKTTITTPAKKAAKQLSKKDINQKPPTNSASNSGPGVTKDQSNDPDKLSDAILAAGIDLKAEESLLLVASQNKVTTSTTQVGMSLAKVHDLKQFGGFMNKVIKENALNQLTTQKMDIVELVQLACDQFLMDTITNSVIFSRHRRRLLKTKVKSSSTQRSDISRALRDLAVKDKEAEEKRMKKRAALGMDTGDDKVEKAGAEETLHRAANATAAMMMSGSKKKKYSWMSGSSNGSGGATQANGSSNSAIAARGDTGIRYREAREEPGIVLRDLVAALETKRMGVDRTLTKGYSRL